MGQRRYGAILGVAAVTALAASAEGTTWYVNGSCGNDAWVGIVPVCAPPGGPKATIQAAINASAEGDEVVVADGVYTGPGNRDISLGGERVVRSANGALGCTIDGQGAGRAFLLRGGEIRGFTITNGWGQPGGGVWIVAGDVAIYDCVFISNEAHIGGALHQVGEAGALKLVGCTFSGNSATVAAGAVAAFGAEFTVFRCTFADNDGASGPGAVASGVYTSLTCAHSYFADNVASFVGGGMAASGTAPLVVNSAFSHNSANHGGGLEICGVDCRVVNCTFADNSVSGLSGCGITAQNGVLWGNTPVQIEKAEIVVSMSDIEGGWPGTGNIDADPLFVQPGTGDLRLSIGSPCVDAGSSAALPADELDVDGDGNTTEPIPLDLAGAARVQNGVVDMGAYEGQFSPGAPASSENDLDEGEFAALVPEGGPLNPIASPAVLLTNVSGGDNASAMVTQLVGLVHPGAGGYSELGSVLVLETSLQDGQFKATVFVPFDSSVLGGAAPQQVRATWYDGVAGNWAMAVWGNANASPGFTGPIGERIYVEAPGPWGVTQDAGDYGVYWDAAQGQGFTWANVDHASDFGVGIAPCPADCVQTPDGQVNIVDMLILLNDWGLSAGISCDVDSDGSIGAADFAGLLKTWGPCTVPAVQAPGAPAPSGALQLARAAPAGSADLDANGAVDVADLELLESCWGAQEGGCPADLDGDGSVGVRDYLHLLAAWDQSASP